MSLSILRREVKKNKLVEVMPSWVSKDNLTFKAFESIKKLKAEKLEYITLHNMKSHYKTRRLYQISAAEVARSVGCATATLNNTSVYSSQFKAYLATINEELEREKEKNIQVHKRTLSAGMKQRKKDEISKELQRAKKDLEELKRKNAAEQVSQVLKSLSLPVRHKLGID